LGNQRPHPGEVIAAVRPLICPGRPDQVHPSSRSYSEVSFGSAR
jgi:hypothetical protein